MTPDLYTAIKDILNYQRPNSIQREAGITGFIGESHAERQRFHALEKAFTQQEPDKKTLVDTWVAMRNKALLLERERLAFTPATSMIQVRWDPGQCFAEHTRNVVLPSLVDDIKDKQVFFSNVYLKARSEFCQLTENNRAQAYMLPLDDMFPDIDAFWKEIGCCLAVDHLYIMVDFNNEENVAWQVIAVTRRRGVIPGFHMVSNAELVKPEAKDVEQKDTGGIVLPLPPRPDALRGGVHFSGIDGKLSLSPINLYGAIATVVASGPAGQAALINAVVKSLAPGIPIEALRDTKLFITSDPALMHSNVAERAGLCLESSGGKPRMLCSSVYWKETREFPLSNIESVLKTVFEPTGFGIQSEYVEETTGKQGLNRVHKLLLIIRPGKMCEWALVAALSEGVQG
jgi:hypothetical protein